MLAATDGGQRSTHRLGAELGDGAAHGARGWSGDGERRRKEDGEQRPAARGEARASCAGVRVRAGGAGRLEQQRERERGSSREEISRQREGA